MSTTNCYRVTIEEKTGAHTRRWHPIVEAVDEAAARKMAIDIGFAGAGGRATVVTLLHSAEVHEIRDRTSSEEIIGTIREPSTRPLYRVFTPRGPGRRVGDRA